MRFSTLKDNTVEYNTKETQNNSKINQELETTRELIEEPVYPSIDVLDEERIEKADEENEKHISSIAVLFFGGFGI